MRNLTKVAPLILCLPLLSIDASHAFGQKLEFRSVLFALDEISATDGPVYALGFTIYSSYGRTDIDRIQSQIISPSGRAFPHQSTVFEMNGFEEVAREVFGKWTIHEVLEDGSSHNFYVNVMPFEYSSFEHAFPTITSPVDGATVPPNFTINIANTEESPIGGYSFEYESTNWELEDRHSSPGGVITVDGRLKSNSPAQVKATIGFQLFYADVEIVDEFGSSTRRAFYYQGATRITLAIAPEPCTSTLLVITCLSVLGIRRR